MLIERDSLSLLQLLRFGFRERRVHGRLIRFRRYWIGGSGPVKKRWKTECKMICPRMLFSKFKNETPCIFLSLSDCILKSGKIFLIQTIHSHFAFLSRQLNSLSYVPNSASWEGLHPEISEYRSLLRTYWYTIDSFQWLQVLADFPSFPCSFLQSFRQIPCNYFFPSIMLSYSCIR